MSLKHLFDKGIDRLYKFSALTIVQRDSLCCEAQLLPLTSWLLSLPLKPMLRKRSAAYSSSLIIDCNVQSYPLTETTRTKIKGVMTQTHSLIACHDCDLLQKNPPLAQFSPRCSRIPFNTRCFWTGTGAQFSPRSIQFNTPLRSTGGHSAPSSRWTAAVVVECPRCGAILRRTQKNSLDRTIAWIIAGLILYFVAVYFPFLAMQSHGISNETALISGIIVLYEQGMGGMALVVLATCLILPLFAMLTLLYILVPLRMNRRLPGAASLFAWNQRLRPWGMMEVYMLGILVSMVKLTKLARIIPGPALYAFIALIFVLAASSVSLDNHLIWDFFQSPPEGGKSDKRP